MLKPKKKIARREVEQDEIIAKFHRARAYYDLNKKYIGYAVTALVVIIIAGYIFLVNRSKNNDKAAAELGKVFSIYDQGSSDPRQYKIAIDGAPERGVMGLKAIVDAYGSTANGELARFYLANACFSTGQIDLALKNYNDFSGGDKVLKAAASAGIGACQEAKRNYSDAASAFEKAANIVSSDDLSPDYLASAARNYAKANEKEKALSIYQRIKKEYPASQAARDADLYISELSV